MLVFVTVGTFDFDALVESVVSEEVLEALRARGYTELVVQCGQTNKLAIPFDITPTGTLASIGGIRVEVWRSKPSLAEDFARADLVIGHAGAGTILEVLRLGKPLIVVPNPTLLHNHQAELANALGNYLKTSTVADLADTIASFDPTTLQPFPPFDGSRFRAIVDREMGF